MPERATQRSVKRCARSEKSAEVVVAHGEVREGLNGEEGVRP